MKKSTGVLKDRRSLILLYFATFFVFTDFYIAQTITPLYILEVGGNEFYSGLQSTLFFLTAVILRFYFGPLADLKGNKLTLIIGTIAFATAPFLFLFSDRIWYIILVRVYQSIGLAAYFSSASSLASALAPKERLGTYIGLYRLVIMATLMIGPSIALRVIELYGYRFYHLLGILIGTIALFFLSFIREPGEERSLRGRARALPRCNMLKFLKQKNLSVIYLSIFVVSLCYGLVLTFVAIFIEQETNIPNPGIFFTLFGLGSVVSNLVSGTLSDRKGRAAVAFPCVALLGIGTASFCFLPLYPFILYLGSVIAGFGYAGSIAVLISWIVDIVSPARRTTALALQDSSIDMGIAVGSFIFGILIPILGMSWSFGLSGFMLFLFAAWRIILLVCRKNEAKAVSR